MALCFRTWREWDGQEVAYFIANYLDLPMYRRSIEKNIDGKWIDRLIEEENFTIAMSQVGIGNLGHQKEIINAFRKLRESNFSKPFKPCGATLLRTSRRGPEKLDPIPASEKWGIRHRLCRKLMHATSLPNLRFPPEKNPFTIDIHSLSQKCSLQRRIAEMPYLPEPPPKIYRQVEEVLVYLRDKKTWPVADIIEEIRSPLRETVSSDIFNAICLSSYSKFSLIKCIFPNDTQLYEIIGELSETPVAYVPRYKFDRLKDQLKATVNMVLGLNDDDFHRFFILLTAIDYLETEKFCDQFRCGLITAISLLQDIERNVITIMSLAPLLSASQRERMENYRKDAKDIEGWFAEVAEDKVSVTLDELMPAIKTALKPHGLKLGKAARREIIISLLNAFDKKKKIDGNLTKEDFSYILRFLTIVNYLEGQRRDEEKWRATGLFSQPEPDRRIIEENILKDLIQITHAGETIQMNMISHLPTNELIVLQDRDNFIKVCNEYFEKKDTQKFNLIFPEECQSLVDNVIDHFEWVKNPVDATTLNDVWATEKYRCITKKQFPHFIEFSILHKYQQEENERRMEVERKDHYQKFIALMKEDFLLFWDPTDQPIDIAKENFFPRNARLSKRWYAEIIGRNFGKLIDDLFEKIDFDTSNFLEDDELCTFFTNLTWKKIPQNIRDIVLEITSLFDTDANGKWDRHEFANFIKFQYLCYLLEADARDVEPLTAQDLFATMALGHSENRCRIYPPRLRRQELERARYLSVLCGDNGEKAAIKIQSSFRAKKAKQLVEEKRKLFPPKEGASPKKMEPESPNLVRTGQEASFSNEEEKEMKRRQESAIKIQKLARGKETRNAFRRAKENPLDPNNKVKIHTETEEEKRKRAEERRAELREIQRAKKREEAAKNKKTADLNKQDNIEQDAILGAIATDTTAKESNWSTKDLSIDQQKALAAHHIGKKVLDVEGEGLEEMLDAKTPSSGPSQDQPPSQQDG